MRAMRVHPIGVNASATVYKGRPTRLGQPAHAGLSRRTSGIDVVLLIGGGRYRTGRESWYATSGIPYNSAEE